MAGTVSVFPEPGIVPPKFLLNLGPPLILGPPVLLPDSAPVAAAPAIAAPGATNATFESVAASAICTIRAAYDLERLSIAASAPAAAGT
jgi:hypothetical protein